MKIVGSEIQKLGETIDRSLRKGYRYVVLPDDIDKAKTISDQLVFFRIKEDSDSFCFRRRSITGKIVDSIPVQSLKLQLDRKMELQQMQNPKIKEPRDIELDLGLIKFQERARTEIFREDIARQLKARNILVSSKELIRLINQDHNSFDIYGRDRKSNAEKKYSIRITQDENRSFTIQRVEHLHTKYSQLLKSDSLQVDVYKSDISAIQKNLKQAQIRKDRFVVFPANGVLHKDSIITFKSSFSALEYVHENTTDRDQYVIRSITAVEKEVAKLSGRKNELTIDEKASCDVKRNSRDRDLLS